jgi:hypothetical protein
MMECFISIKKAFWPEAFLRKLRASTLVCLTFLLFDLHIKVVERILPYTINTPAFFS